MVADYREVFASPDPPNDEPVQLANKEKGTDAAKIRCAVMGSGIVGSA